MSADFRVVSSPFADAAPPSPDPEPAPPSLGDVINAVKAAFEQAIQISTDGAVHEALEKAAEEHAPRKTPAEQAPAAENVADHTTEEAAAVRVSEEETVVLTVGEPDAHVSESNEQTDEESVQGPAQEATLTQDTDEEPTIEQESFQERSDSEPVKSIEELVRKAVETVVQEPGGESVLLGPQVGKVYEGNTENLAEDLEMEESPVHAFTADTQNENNPGREAGNKEVERTAGVPENAWKPQMSEMEKTVEPERVEVTIRSEDVKAEGLQEDVKMQPGVLERPEAETESEIRQKERHDGIVVEDVGGVIVEEQLEEEHEAEVEAEKVKNEAEIQTFLEEEEVPPTRKTSAVETQQEAGIAISVIRNCYSRPPQTGKIQ